MSGCKLFGTPTTATKNYALPSEGLVKIIVYDITGKGIQTLVNEFKQSGTYNTTFHGSNLSSGIYFYKLFINGNAIDTKRMVLIK